MYKGFNKNITKKDLSKKEMVCYDKLMEGIKKSSKKEKEEVSHLMEVYLDAGGKIHSNCLRCGEKIKKVKGNIYCDDCLMGMWGPDKAI